MHKRPTKNLGKTAKTAQPQPAPTPQNEKKSAPISEADEASARAARVKSSIRKILLASPLFPRLYADVVISSAPNSYEAKILARNYQKIVDRTNFGKTNLDSIDRTPMPSYPNVKVCTHIKVTGVRCGSPALRGEQFCYFHQRMLRTVNGPPDSRLHHVALLENEEAIQASLMEVVNALIRKTIDLPRAELVLRALNTAVRNARRVRFDNASPMVTQVPDYPEPKPVANSVQTLNPPTAHVGTAAPGCPGGPAAPGRSAVATLPQDQQAAVARSPHEGPKAGFETANPDPTRPKPPRGLKEAGDPKNGKIAAHRARGA